MMARNGREGRNERWADGLSPHFYVDWLMDADRALPHLGISTLLSTTSKIGDRWFEDHDKLHAWGYLREA